MKKIILLFNLLIFMLVFYGCPYDTKVPIDKPNIKIDKSYTGLWTFKGGSTQYLVTNLDDFHLKIAQLPIVSKEDASKNTQDTTIYHAFFSQVKGTSFLNITQKSKYDAPGNATYYLYKVNVKSDNEIVLIEVTSNIKEKFSTSEKLKAYIEKYMDLSFFYGAESVYIREL